MTRKKTETEKKMTERRGERQKKIRLKIMTELTEGIREGK